jgi:malate synthase
MLVFYIRAWLRGHGAVALYNLMEDAATAEISRTVWQWLHNEVVIEGGRTFNMTLYKDIFDDEVEKSSPIWRGEHKKTASLN